MSARPSPLGRPDSGCGRRGSCPRTRQWARTAHARGCRPQAHQTPSLRPAERCQQADEIRARSFQILEAIAVDRDIAGGVFDRGPGAWVECEVIAPIELGEEGARRRPFVGRAAEKNGGGHAASYWLDDPVTVRCSRISHLIAMFDRARGTVRL